MMGATNNLLKCNCYKTALDIDKQCSLKSPNISIKQIDGGSSDDDLPSTPRPRASSNGSAIKPPIVTHDGSPHHLITGHANSSRSAPTHSRCNSGTILQCNCVSYTPQSPRSSHVKLTNDLASSSPEGCNGSQHKIVVPEATSEIIKESPVPSPHAPIRKLNMQLPDQDTKNVDNIQIQNEKFSPNFSDTYQLSTITNKSRSCLVYEPTDPWTKMTEVDKKHGRNLSKTNHRSLEEQTNDPWVSNIASTGSQRQLCHQSKSESRNEELGEICQQNKKTNISLIIPMESCTKNKQYPKLQRCKTPISDEYLKHNDDQKALSTLDTNPNLSAKNIHASSETLPNSVDKQTSCKLLAKSPKFGRILNRTATSPESENSSLLSDKQVCSCDKKSPKCSPRRLSPNLGYKLLSNDTEVGHNLCQTPEAQSVAYCTWNEYPQNFHQSSDNPSSPKKQTSNYCPKILDDKPCLNMIQSSSPIRDKHKDIHNNSDPLLETRC